jgi:hypothetical protein
VQPAIAVIVSAVFSAAGGSANTLGRAPGLVGVRIERTSLNGHLNRARFDARPASTSQPAVSVMPQTSNIGTPSARYQWISSGEIGAAPVTRYRALWMPIILRTLSKAAQRASMNLSFSHAGTAWSASTCSATARPTDSAYAYAICWMREASRTAIVTAE